MPRRRVWCETVPAEIVGAPATVALLRRFAVDPILAVWPATVEAARTAAARFADAGLRPALWPMLPDEEGRWLGAGNAARFCAFAGALASAAGASEIVLDLEPPIEAVRATLASRAVHARTAGPAGSSDAHLLALSLDGAGFERARSHIVGLHERLAARGVALSAAVALPVLLDGPDRTGWQEALGTPTSGVAWDHVSPMLYTSIVEGWSRGLLARRDALAILGWSCLASSRLFGAAAGASLGAVGTGAFGDEPTYRSPAELAEDVSVALAAGVSDLALFDLGGVLGRPPAEAWLEAFTEAGPAASLPEVGPRARLFLGGASIAGRAFGLLARARDALRE